MNIFRFFIGKVLFALITVAVVGGSLMLLGENATKKNINQNSAGSAGAIPTVFTETQSKVTPVSEITTIPSSIPRITSSSKFAFECSPEVQAQINAYSEQTKNEYETCKNNANAKIQQERSACKNSCDSTKQSEYNNCLDQAIKNVFVTPPFDINACTTPVNNKWALCTAGCFGLGIADLNACTASYQEKQKNIFSMHFKLCRK